MIPTLIKYSQEFKSIEGNRWLGIEIPVPPGEDPLETFKKAETLIRQAFNPSLVPISEALQGVLPVSQVDVLIKDIEGCTEIDWINGLGVQVGLVAFREKAEENELSLKAYRNKFNELAKIK